MTQEQDNLSPESLSDTSLTHDQSEEVQETPDKAPQKSPKNLDRVTDSLLNRHMANEAIRVIGGLRSQRARSWTERLLTRTTSGALYAITVVICLFWGRIPTMVLVADMAWLCCSEFYRIVRMGGRMPNELIGLSASVLYPIVTLLNPSATTVVTLLLMLACGTWYVLTPRFSISDAAITIFGSIYTGLLLSSVVTIRMCDAGLEGALLTFGTMGSIWLSDACAYFVGSRLGKHKMAPRISPNKSWEGFFGGMVGSIFIWLLLVILNVKNISLPIALIAGVLVDITGVMGDLFESRLKRSVGVKDSGNLLPGHGGLLDRTDSLLFGCMTAFFILRFGGIL